MIIYLDQLRRPKEEEVYVFYNSEILNQITDDLNCESPDINRLKIYMTSIFKEIYSLEKQSYSQGLFIFCSSGELKIENEILSYKKGEILYLKNNIFSLSDEVKNTAIILYKKISIQEINQKTELRVKLAGMIKNSLKEIKKLPEWNQCLQSSGLTARYINSGTYGTVYKSYYIGIPFAIKISKLKDEAIQGKVYDKNISSWKEVFILKNIINPIIENSICPNLPFLIENMTCASCKIKIDGEFKDDCHSVSTIIEYANGDLSKLFQLIENLSKNFLNKILTSLLFQLMAGLYSIQKYGQIMNFDIKKSNILYYSITPGGFWEYEIQGEKYYVENFGVLLILNDFGISRIFSPQENLRTVEESGYFRLGSRFCLIENGKLLPIQVDNGEKFQVDKHTFTGGKFVSNGKKVYIQVEGETKKPVFKLSSDIKKILKNNNIKTGLDFFNHPDIIPPCEFYNDTQDIIRMFTGGKKTTQKGNHIKPSFIPNSFLKKLSPYVGKAENASKKSFSQDASQLCAVEFIKKFFIKNKKLILGEKIIETYKMS